MYLILLYKIIRAYYRRLNLTGLQCFLKLGTYNTSNSCCISLKKKKGTGTKRPAQTDLNRIEVLRVSKPKPLIAF